MADISGVFTKAAFAKDEGLYDAAAIAYPQTPVDEDIGATHQVPFSEESMSKNIEHLKSNALTGSGQVLPQGLIKLTAAGGIGGPLTWQGWERLLLCAMGFENPEDSPAFINATADPVVITDATNAEPIVITTTDVHGCTTGDGVRIEGVVGNTNANGDWVVTVVDTTHYSLDGSAGNAAYVSDGTSTLYNAFVHLFELDEALQDQAWVAGELDGYTPPSANDRKVRRGQLGFLRASDYVTSSCFVDKMTITGSGSEIKISFDLIGYDVVTGDYNSSNWTLPAGSAALALFQQAVVKVGTRAGEIAGLVEYGASGFEIVVNENLKTDDISTVSAPNIVMPIRNGPREVTLKLDFPRYNTTIETLLDYAALNTELAAEIRITGPVFSGLYNHRWNLFMGSLRAKNPATPIGGGGVIPSSVEFETARPGAGNIFDSGTNMVSVTLMKDSELIIRVDNAFAKNYLLET